MSKCEENFCEYFQSAICLHCMHRLCIYHIEDHQKILLNQVNELKNQVNQVNIILMNASKMIVEERKAEEKKCIDWRKQKIDEIEREYIQMTNSIKNRQKTLEQLELELNQRLKMEIQQPLEHMSIQKSTNPHSIDAIQLAIQTIRKDSTSLIWNSQPSTLPKQKKIKPWKPRNVLWPLFRDVGRNSADRIHEFVQVKESIQSSIFLNFMFIIFRR